MSTQDHAIPPAHLGSHLRHVFVQRAEDFHRGTRKKNKTKTHPCKRSFTGMELHDGAAFLIPYSIPKSHLTRSQAVSSLVSFFPHEKSSCQRCPMQCAMPFLFHSPTSSSALPLLPTLPRPHTAPSEHLRKFWLPSALFGDGISAAPKQAGWWSSTTPAQAFQLAMLQVIQYWEGKVFPWPERKKGWCIFRIKDSGFKWRRGD